MQVRRVDADEVELCASLGRFVLAAYTTLPGHVPEPDYEATIADVAARAAMVDTEVLAAFDDDDDDDGAPLGCVTFVAGAGSPLAEHDVAHAASFRMLGVDPAAQGRGAGRVLVEACIARAEVLGVDAIVLHSTPWMGTAHRLYGSLGFERDETLDWLPVPAIPLWGFRLMLR